MGITRERWDEEADIQAARDFGRATYKLRVARHFAPHFAVLFAVGLVGFAVWKLWHFAEGLRSDGPQTSAVGGASAVPLWAWFAVGLLTLATAVAFHPGRIDRLGVLAAKLLVIPAAWLLLAGFIASRVLG
jgi:hypothetical protein